MPLLVAPAAFSGDRGLIVAVSVFGACLVLLCAASTLYHSARSERAKRRLQSLDHGAIYQPIAGTHAPFAQVPLRGDRGSSLFGVVWGSALTDVVFKLFAARRFLRISTPVYLALGCAVLIAVVPVVRRVPDETIGWLLAGGLSSTAGAAFCAARRLRQTRVI
jgi:hemolysin III